ELRRGGWQGGRGAAAAAARPRARGGGAKPPPATRSRLLPGGGPRPRGFVQSDPFPPPLQAPSRRHPRAVPDALKNRLKAASLAKRPGSKASIIYSRPGRKSRR